MPSVCLLWVKKKHASISQLAPVILRGQLIASDTHKKRNRLQAGKREVGRKKGGMEAGRGRQRGAGEAERKKERE